MVQPTLAVLDKDSVARVVNTINPNGPASVADSQPTLQIMRSSDYLPGYDVPAGTEVPAAADPGGSQNVRAQILCDEGSFRCNFSGSAIGISVGSLTLTNGSTGFSGGASLDTYDMHVGDYIKLSADGETAWARIHSLDTRTSGTLDTPYTGTGGTGAAICAIMKPSTGAGASISVGSSVCTISAGTTAGSVTEVERDIDVAPMTLQAGVTISQRIANQDIYVGAYDTSHAATPWYYAWFRFNGTVNTTVICEAGFNREGVPTGADIESATVTLPDNANTASSNRYRIEILANKLRFYVNGKIVAEFHKTMPRPVDLLTMTIRVVNGTTPATSTTISTDYTTANNFNTVQVMMPSDTENVVASAVPDVSYNFTQTGVIAVNTDLQIIDMSQMKALSVQLTSMGTAGVLTCYATNDLSVLGTATAMYPVGGTAAVLASTAATAGHWTVTKQAKYLRLRLTTATTAGTTTLYSVATQYMPPVSLAKRITDLTNYMPTMDAAARRGYMQVTDGTNSASVLATILALKTDMSSVAGTAAVNAGVAGVLAIGGNVAHSAAATANPVPIGGRVITTLDTSLTNNDTSYAMFTTAGQLTQKPYGSAENDWQYATPIASPITNTTAVALKALGAASIRNYVTGLQYQNTSATASIVTIQDGSTVIWTGYAPANMAVPAVVTFNTPLRGTAATAMNFVVNTTATNTFVSAQGYQSF